VCSSELQSWPQLSGLCATGLLMSAWEVVGAPWVWQGSPLPHAGPKVYMVQAHVHCCVCVKLGLCSMA